MQELLKLLDDVRNEIKEAHNEHTNQVNENDDLKHEVQKLKLELADANGQIRTLATSNVDLTTRLVRATEDSTYFREKVGAATSAATDLAQKMVQIIADVERKPKPMLSLEDSEERKPEPLEPIVSNGTGKKVIQIKLTAQELKEIAPIEEGVEFEMWPDTDVRIELKQWYRQKIGWVPDNYKKAPGLLLKRVDDKLLFIRFVPTAQVQVQREPNTAVRTPTSSLPQAPNIPANTSGNFDAHGQLGDDGAEIPRFLRPPDGGARADITVTETPER